MNDTPSNPVAPAVPKAGSASDTAGKSLEATGGEPGASPNAATLPSDQPNAPHPAALDYPQRIGEYAVVQKIGEGGMGAVYLAEDAKLGRKVAVKTIKRELAASKIDRDRFIREARAAAAVESDYIVPILHIGEAADGSPFIVMPFLKGEMLADCLAREPKADLSLILKVAGDVAEGLTAAHAEGLIHRDIKPSNIWLEGDSTSTDPGRRVRRCKILDFGLARSVNKEEAQITASGAILGTPSFMAPEQARGEKVDHRADLFSLGVTLYRMATGRLPFDAPTPMAVLIRLATEMPPPVRELAPHLPPGLIDLIDRLMCKDRERRLQSAAEVAATVRELIEEFQSQKPTPAARAASGPTAAPHPISASFPQVLPTAEEYREPSGSVSELLPPAKRSRLPWLLAAACLLALVSLGLGLSAVLKDQKADADVAKNEVPPQQANSPKTEPPKQEPDAKKNSEPKKRPGPEIKKQPEPAPDADRKAAEWALSANGTVMLSGDSREFKHAKDLPKEPFKVSKIYLTQPLKDADLAVGGGCKGLDYLYLSGTQITSVALTPLKDCKDLKYLYLSGTQVDDTAVPVIKQFTKLTDLAIGETKISEKGVMDLAKALPGCRIQHNGGTIEPPKK